MILFEEFGKDEIVIATGDEGQTETVDGWANAVFGVYEVDESAVLVHLATAQPMATFDSIYVAMRAARLAGAVGSWLLGRWPLTECELGLIWFRAGLQPILAGDHFSEQEVVWTSGPSEWMRPGDARKANAAQAA